MYSLDYRVVPRMRSGDHGLSAIRVNHILYWKICRPFTGAFLYWRLYPVRFGEKFTDDL